MRTALSLTLAALLSLPVNALAHSDLPPEPMDLDGLMSAFNWTFDVDIEIVDIDEGFYVLYGVGGNILVSSGDDGVVIVDDQFPQLMKKLKKAMRSRGDREVDFAINTHWHFDHAEGNLSLGPEGVWLVSQANSREMMKSDHVINLVAAAYEQKAYPPEAWPDITYDDTMQFHLNGERIDLYHFGPAHTTGDTAVVFRGRNAVHLGDVYNNSGYPFIDAGNGGSIDGVIHFCEQVLARIDEDTVVVPGHGPLANYSDLKNYVQMLKIVRGEIVAMIKDGKSLEEIIAAGITATWDERLGDPTMFINRSYTSLTQRYLP